MKHKKTLYIHAGGPKTGTSSIQSFLASNALELQRHNYIYKHSLDMPTLDLPNCGNGLPLLDLLADENATQRNLDEILLGYFGLYENAICSSEYFVAIKPTGWKRIRESGRRLNITVNIIFFVRDLVPFFLSAYDQAIKNHQEHMSLAKWIVHSDFSKTWQHADALRTIEAIFPKSRIQVIHYKEGNQGAIESFLSSVGIGDMTKDDRIRSFPKTNRSLTSKERKILIEINRACSGHIGKPLNSKELADLFLQSQAKPEPEMKASDSSSLSMLGARFEDDVNWINSTFFGCSEVVSVFGVYDQQSSRKTSKSTSATDDGTTCIALSWIIDQLASIHVRSQHELVNRLSAIQANYAQIWHPRRPLPEIPKDFDVIAYVLLNRDILFTDMDPVMHFIAHGMAEGRPYSFNSKLSLLT